MMNSVFPRALPSQRALPSVGDRVGGYEILAPLAEGGMAAVFVARPVDRPDTRSALKVLLPHLTKDQAFVDMFLDELRIASRIDHPNVVRVVGGGNDDGLPYLVMELLRGRTLAAWTEAARARAVILPTGAILYILASVAEGLHAAHETRGADGRLLGVVHRDVSPQNVHVGEDGRVVVLDFGIAAGRGRATATRTGELKGKFHYLAPEQVARERPIDRRADLWALGAIAHEFFGGRAPFLGEDDASTLWNVMYGEVASLRAVARVLPDEVVAVLDACLTRAVERRPSDAKSVAEVLRRAAQSEGVGDELALAAALAPLAEPSAPLPPTRVAQGLGRATPRSRLVPIALILGVIAAVGAFWLGSTPAPEVVPASPGVSAPSEADDGTPAADIVEIPEPAIAPIDLAASPSEAVDVEAPAEATRSRVRRRSRARSPLLSDPY